MRTRIVQRYLEASDDVITLAVDFDGVINSYKSGWTDATLPDPPVPGAIEWLSEMTDHFKIIIHSARLNDPEQESLIQNWLLQNGMSPDIMARLEFMAKPQAQVYIDDRAWEFSGQNFPTTEEITMFTPWYEELSKLAAINIRRKKKLQIWDSPTKIIETRDWRFNRRNVNRIAWEYDAEVQEYSASGRATLKDSNGRLLWVDYGKSYTDPTKTALKEAAGAKTLYHIGNRPAMPKPYKKDDPGGWARKWLPGGMTNEPVVFMSDDWKEIAAFHHVRGNVYAYKIPQAAIKESGGLHRYDKAKEVLIPQSVWDKYQLSKRLLGKVAGPKKVEKWVERTVPRTMKRIDPWRYKYGPKEVEDLEFQIESLKPGEQIDLPPNVTISARVAAYDFRKITYSVAANGSEKEFTNANGAIRWWRQLLERAKLTQK